VTEIVECGRISDIDRLTPGLDAFRRQAVHDLADLVGVVRGDRDVGRGDRQPECIRLD